jgi:hypothetical protein
MQYFFLKLCGVEDLFHGVHQEEDGIVLICAASKELDASPVVGAALYIYIEFL